MQLYVLWVYMYVCKHMQNIVTFYIRNNGNGHVMILSLFQYFILPIVAVFP